MSSHKLQPSLSQARVLLSPALRNLTGVHLHAALA